MQLTTKTAWVPSTYSEGNISSSCHQWKTAGHTLCINMFVVNRISHHAMIIYTYPTFSTHLSRYLVSRLWLLSHGLSYINFSLLLHSLNTLSIEQNSSSGSAFQKTPATVFRFNRWSRQDSWKCTRKHTTQSKRNVEWHTFFSFQLLQWMSVQVCSRWFAFSLLLAWLTLL